MNSIIESSPHDVDTLVGVGNVYAKLGLNEKSLKCYNEAISLNPYTPWIWGDLAHAFRQLGYYKEAEECRDRMTMIGTSFHGGTY